MSSWSGDFRGAIDPATVLSVIHDEHTIAQVIADNVYGRQLVIRQSFVPLLFGHGRRGPRQVTVSLTPPPNPSRTPGHGPSPSLTFHSITIPTPLAAPLPT